MTRNQSKLPLLQKLTGVPSARRRLAKGGAFASDEDGGMTIIALFVFILMLTMGGISVDLMRHELERTQLQAALDGAVLAGAGAPADATEEEIRAIVEDFVVKSGEGDYLHALGEDDVVATLNSRRVHASGSKTMGTYIMKLMNVDTLSAGGGATAEVRTPKLEIVLVLDVSGSMQGTKLDNLKVAAKDFVSTVLSNSSPGATVISVIPYSWGVTPSDGIFEALNVRKTHDYSNCIEFEDGDFANAAIDTTTSFGQTVYTTAEVWDGLPSFDGVSKGLLTDPTTANYNRTCFTDDYFRIMPFSINEGDLHAKIDSLQAAGSTSSHLGMKWAAGLLDPQFTNILTSLQTPRQVVGSDGNITTEIEVDPSLANVPAVYDEPDTQKIIVLMGDGANDGTYSFSDPNGLMERNSAAQHSATDYRGPESYLHRVTTGEQVFDYAYRVRNPAVRYTDGSFETNCISRPDRWHCVYTNVVQEVFYVYNPNSSRYYPNVLGPSLTAADFDALVAALPEFVLDPVTGTQLTDPVTGDPILSHIHYSWEEAWGLVSPNYIGWVSHNWAPLNQLRTNRETTVSKDIKMNASCNATKSNGVIVYSIGFEVPEEGHAETELRKCASDTTHYYRASGVNISDAFGSIAANVQKLRLTQ